MRTSLIEGRYFDDRDSSDAPGVAIVSRSWADRFIPGESAVGKRLKLGAWDSTRPWLLIVGVVGDVHQTSLEAAPRPIIYYPFSQRPASSMTLIVRTADAASAVSAFRREVTAIDKEQPITGARNLSDYISRSLAARRFNTLLLALFSAAATVIATVGVYGVMAQSVIQRTREMAIRVALGATPRDVRRLILRHGLLLSLTGLVVGLGLAFWLTRLMTGLMFQVSVTDPATFVLLSALLLLTTMAASYFPARRATQVDPIVALRRE
jgi:predicted permease